MIHVNNRVTKSFALSALVVLFSFGWQGMNSFAQEREASKATFYVY